MLYISVMIKNNKKMELTKTEIQAVIEVNEDIFCESKNFEDVSKAYNRLVEIWALTGVASEQIATTDPETIAYFEEVKRRA